MLRFQEENNCLEKHHRIDDFRNHNDYIYLNRMDCAIPKSLEIIKKSHLSHPPFPFSPQIIHTIYDFPVN